jgi:hypothetical protein
MNPILIQETEPVFGMNYDIGFNAFTVRRKDFIAAGIRWFERWDRLPGTPPVSHAFVITGEDSTVEAFGDGVKVGSLQVYLKDPDVGLLVRRPKGWTQDLGERIAQEAGRHIGERYGYALIGAMALSNTFLGKGLDLVTRGWFGRTIDNLADGKSQQICSELVARADRTQPELAMLGCLRLEPNQVTPALLFGDNEVFEEGAFELVPPVFAPVA